MKILKFNLIFFMLMMSISSQEIQQKVLEHNTIQYLSHELIIKIKNIPSQLSRENYILPNSLTDKLSFLGIKEIKPLFNLNEKNNTLNKIFSIKYENEIDPFVYANKMKKLSEIEWAEPRYVYPLDFIPNDPNYSSQWNLAKVKANLAWDLSQGDTSIIIGIIDTGVDWDHPDLADNIWLNWDENPTNGIDDDNNGYIDDWCGWDFCGINGTPDNNPMEDRPDHGTHVAGISSATTNNGIGISSLGFKCKLMCVKTSQDNYRDPGSGLPYIISGYEGIVYAVQNGAKVINCSWGGSGYSIFGKEVIEFAVSHGSLVIAAAGNNNSSIDHFPSGYSKVLSVASTDQGDVKSSFSNYGYSVDVTAPGDAIYSTWQNNTYKYADGTSMASPLVSGLAGLVFSKFQNYTPLQVAEQIRITCDNIYNSNPSYTDMLGRGRINSFRTLSENNSKSVRAISFDYSDVIGGNGNGIIEPGETISLGIKFINYLKPVSALTIQLESKTSNATVVNGFFNSGSHNTLDTFNNYLSRFTFSVSSSIPTNTKLIFKIVYFDGGYSDFEITSIIGRPTYATISGNDIALTITSKGTLAFNDYPDNLQGDGFIFQESNNLMFEGGLMLATSSNKMSDCVRGPNQNFQNTDFVVEQPFVIVNPGHYANIEGSAIFNDNGAGNNKLGITTKLQSYLYSSSSYKNFVILRYRLVNKSATSISNLYSGLFLDWDLIDGQDDVASYDSIGQFGYAYHVGGNIYVGAALISSANYGYWAINNSGGDGGFSIYDGFTDQEKWTSLSSGIGKKQAGAGDVSHVISAGPFQIAVNDTLNTAYVLASANSLNNLRSAIINARNLYPTIPTSARERTEITLSHFSLEQNYPNPFNPSTSIQYTIGSLQSANAGEQHVVLKIIDVLGNEIKILVNEYKSPGKYKVNFSPDDLQLSSGVYFYQLKVGNYIKTKKMLLLR
jgi:subtilisin family serine protease